ncbi:MAG: ABC transporter permease subunit [Devosiaceae bacterium]|nr:ABC transporter permease subunit [Devosiaceae bacterium MH13]
MAGPVLMLVWQLVAGATWDELASLFAALWSGDIFANLQPARAMLINSLILAIGIAAVKTVISLLAAYALLAFRVPGRDLIFGAILLSLFYPIESRILPTFAVVDTLGLLNSYAGMILPVVASGLGTLLFRLHLGKVPQELFDAARLDGAGPLRCLVDIVLPLSMPMVLALFLILFVLGWNQYVWPIMVTTTSLEHDTLVRGMTAVNVNSRAGLMLVLMAMLPPVLLLLALQRWLLRGLQTGMH